MYLIWLQNIMFLFYVIKYTRFTGEDVVVSLYLTASLVLFIKKMVH